MKNFSTLLLVGALSAMSASAVNVERIRISDVNKSDVTQIKEIRAGSKTRSVEPKEFPGGEYVSLGMGYMTDDIVAPIYGLSPVTYQVEIQQSSSDPNFYRVIAPYGEAFATEINKQLSSSLDSDEYDSAGECYIDIDATDPDDVYFAKTDIGCDWGYGPMYIGITSSGTVTLKDGVFTASINGLAYVDDDGAIASNRNGQFRILLPGIEPQDFSFELTAETQCLTSRTFKGSVSVGADVAQVKYAVVENMQEDEMLAYVREIGESDGFVFKPRGDFEYQMAEGVKKETLIMVALDKDASIVAYDWVSYYFIDDDPDGWESIGTAKYTDVALPSFFSNISSQTMNVEMQRNKMRPHYYRLVNPYANHLLAFGSYIHSGHNHYMYLNAEDEECIFFEESPIGLDLGYGLIRINSYAQYFLDAGYDMDEIKLLECGAIYEDNVLTFPEESIVVSMFDYSDGDWYETEGIATLELPEGFEFASVKNIEADDNNAKIELYNLQGIRIDNPQEGQIYIKRQGSQSSKIVF